MIQIASADGQFEDLEFDMLSLLSSKLQVDRMELDALLTDPTIKTYPASEVKRISIFFSLWKMVFVDGHAHVAEIEKLKEITLHLGLPSQALHRLLDIQDLYAEGNIPIDTFIEVFKAHHN